MSKRKRIPADERDRIDNYKEVIHALATEQTLMPGGDYIRPEVDNPRLTNDAPKFLRVRIPRKSTKTFKIIEAAREYDLVIGDAFQLDKDYEDEMIQLRFEKEDRGQ